MKADQKKIQKLINAETKKLEKSTSITDKFGILERINELKAMLPS